jgi:arginyl-tRNA synthetase
MTDLDDGAPCNALTTIERGIGATNELTPTVQVSRQAAGPDITIIHPPRSLRRGSARALGGRPGYWRVQRGVDRIDISLSPKYFEAAGRALEAGSDSLLAADEVAAGRRFIVDYCDPNANKALHVGHLRNIAIGHAVARVLSTCGARVTTESQVGDMGHSMAEAIAGYAQFYGNATPVSVRMKGDRFVGECYRRYVQAHASDASEGPVVADPVLAREVNGASDAVQVMSLLRSGDDQVRALWLELRRWAMEGQAATLARLGAAIERPRFESDFIELADRIVELALRQGLARSTSEGIVHDTGNSEYPRLLLRRADGLPTQHARYLAYRRSQAQTTSRIEIMGEEWAQLVSPCERILNSLFADHSPHMTRCVGHGMIKVGDDLVKSSEGEAPLVDDLLEKLTESSEITRLVSESNGLGAYDLAVVVLLGYGLSWPTKRPGTFSHHDLLDCARNPGWVLARALASACRAGCYGRMQPEPDNPDYRYLVRHALLRPRYMRKAFRSVDPYELTRYYTHLCKWYLATEPSASLARMMRTVLEEGFWGIGLLRQRIVKRDMDQTAMVTI